MPSPRVRGNRSLGNVVTSWGVAAKTLAVYGWPHGHNGRAVLATERITFTNAAGHELSGALELPAGKVRSAALFAHCFTCTKQSRAATRITRALADIGLATLRFDFTGLGGSEGDFGNDGFASDVDDIVAAAEYLGERFGADLLLIGHSLGGAAVLAAAHRLPEASAVATIGAPSDVPHVLARLDGNLDAIESEGEGEVKIAGRVFTISNRFIESTRGADILKGLGELRKPLLFLHAPTDQIVSIDHAGELFKSAKHPKSFVSLDTADHLLTRGEDAHYAAAVIAGWAGRYLPEQDAPELREGVLVQTGHGKFGTQVRTPGHSFVADEPKSYGGEDAGPTPYDLLLAGLGTCTVMTLKMYAAREDIPLESAEVHLTHERDHQKDCDHCETDDDARIQAIYRTLRLMGDFSDEQRARLVAIADKCPVHRTLEGELHIHTNEERA